MYNTAFSFPLFSEYLVPLHVIHVPALPAIYLILLSLLTLNRDALTSLKLPITVASIHPSYIVSFPLCPLDPLWDAYLLNVQSHPMSVSKVYCMDFERQRCIKQSIFCFLSL